MCEYSRSRYSLEVKEFMLKPKNRSVRIAPPELPKLPLLEYLKNIIHTF